MGHGPTTIQPWSTQQTSNTNPPKPKKNEHGESNQQDIPWNNSYLNKTLPFFCQHFQLLTRLRHNNWCVTTTIFLKLWMPWCLPSANICRWYHLMISCGFFFHFWDGLSNLLAWSQAIWSTMPFSERSPITWSIQRIQKLIHPSIITK